MPVVKIYKHVNAITLILISVIILAPPIEKLWGIYYARLAPGSLRMAMRMIRNAYVFQEQAAISLFWPLPSIFKALTYTSPASRLLVTLFVHLLVSMIVYEVYLFAQGTRTPWVFIVRQEDDTDEEPIDDESEDEEYLGVMLIVCSFCNTAFLVADEQEDDVDEGPVDHLCPNCLMPQGEEEEEVNPDLHQYVD